MNQWFDCCRSSVNRNYSDKLTLAQAGIFSLKAAPRRTAPIPDSLFLTPDFPKKIRNQSMDSVWADVPEHQSLPL
ncbi:MAG TPA: hypothetical protein VNQ79_14465 [Blastocatellia bacterium]|nr:hypothetical protein [Blastocatellia bacterium]